MTEYIVLKTEEWQILYHRAFEKGKAEARKQYKEVIEEWNERNTRRT